MRMRRAKPCVWDLISVYSESLKFIKTLGTDPAGPLFQGSNPSKRFDRSHARFVDAIHTNQYEFGYVNSMGMADFYVNGGGPVQPQCEDSDSGEDRAGKHRICNSQWPSEQGMGCSTSPFCSYDNSLPYYINKCMFRYMFI